MAVVTTCISQIWTNTMQKQFAVSSTQLLFASAPFMVWRCAHSSDCLVIVYLRMHSHLLLHLLLLLLLLRLILFILLLLLRRLFLLLLLRRRLLLILLLIQRSSQCVLLTACV